MERRTFCAGLPMSMMLHRIGLPEQGAKGSGGIGEGVDFFEADFATRPWFGAQNWGSAIHHVAQNRTYECWTAHYGPPVVRVRYYDHGTEEWSDPVTVATITGGDGDHRNGSIGIDADGYLYIAFGAHGDNLQWTISDSPHDISSWTEQTPLSGNNTYPRWAPVGTTMCLFYRKGPFGSDEYSYVVRTGTPSGGSLTLGSENALIDFGGTDRPYVTELRPDGAGGVLFALSRSTAGDFTGANRKHVYFARYIVSSGALENFDGSTSTASGSLPINTTLADSDYREFESMGDNLTGNPSWCWDSDGNVHVAFFDSEAGGDLDIKHMVRIGAPASWFMTSTVATLKDGGVGDYLQMFSIVPAASGKVELWYSVSTSAQDGGDMTRKVRSAAGSWGSAQTIVAEIDHAIGLPQSVQNGHSDFRVVVSEFTQSQSENYADRDLMKRYHHGDRGFVQVPEYTDPLWHMVHWQTEFEGPNGSTNFVDQSIRNMPLMVGGDAQMQSNRLVLDGDDDHVDSISGEGLTFHGRFAVELPKAKIVSVSGSQTLFSRFNPAGDNRSIQIAFRGDLSPKRLRVTLSTDGTSATNTAIDFEWTPNDQTEYAIILSRDAADKVRVHLGEAGSDASMVASATYAGALHDAVGVPPRIGARSIGAGSSPHLFHDGSEHALRITVGSERYYGTDSDVTPPTVPFGTGDGSG